MHTPGALWIALMTAGTLPATPVTYSGRVARVIQENCQTCHHPGAAAPFSLMTYDDVVKHADNIREAVTDGRMPPWFADPHYGKFANDRRLKAEDRAALLAWIDGGRERGDPKEMPPGQAYPDGWSIGTPDLVIEMPHEEAIPASGTVPYRTFSSGPVPWTEDALITAVEVIPGNRGVVHHAQLYIDGFYANAEVVSFAPGSPPVVMPPDTVCLFPTGRELFWLMHYTPNGRATTDRSKVGFKFWKGDKPPKYARTVHGVMKLDIDIPPGAANYRGENHWVADGRELVGIRPHMHLRGKDFRCDAVCPDGRTECLLSVPHYSFDWQLDYFFAERLTLPAGTRLNFISHWDNSAGNPNNPDPTRRVVNGEQTDDEMQTVELYLHQPYERAVRGYHPKELPAPLPVKYTPPATPAGTNEPWTDRLPSWEWAALVALVLIGWRIRVRKLLLSTPRT